MWHHMRIEGTVYEETESRTVLWEAGDRFLDNLFCRLLLRMEQGIEETVGRFPCGLLAGMAVQLTLGQWASWPAFRDSEKLLGNVPLLIRQFVKRAPSSGRSLPHAEPPAAGPGSPRI